MAIKSYKGMDKNMQCRGFQYKVGETYTTDKAVICESGFHACEYPLDVFQHYDPAASRFFEVEQSGEISRDGRNSKVASSKIKIVAEVTISELIKASIDSTRHKADDANSSAGDFSSNSSTSNRSANSSTGYCSANSSTSNRSANSSTGRRSANSSTGNYSSNSSTGGRSANSSTGSRSANASTGCGSANTSAGYGSANITTGRNSTNEGGVASVNVGWGKNNRCRGAIGSYLVLSLWGDWDGEKYPLITAKMFLVDGENVKSDVWYTLDDNGELVEVEHNV